MNETELAFLEEVFLGGHVTSAEFTEVVQNNQIYNFVVESNKIEGITREPTKAEIEAHKRFIMLDKVTIDDLVDFVKVVQPDAQLRNLPNIPGVRVGNHIAPPSGPYIQQHLQYILDNIWDLTPYRQHCEYLTLHPFTDGNGRSSRVLWLWRMNGSAPLGFLHKFYYQTLDAADGKTTT